LSASYNWTGWYDRDDPTGVADFEVYVDYATPPCGSNAKPVGADCRVKTTGLVWYSANQVLLDCYECSAKGLACFNKYQTNGQCQDYEIRFLCLSQ
ncbi:Hypothetical predicted protein, partial [Paramuricea clavata]